MRRVNMYQLFPSYRIWIRSRHLVARPRRIDSDDSADQKQWDWELDGRSEILQKECFAYWELSCWLCELQPLQEGNQPILTPKSTKSAIVECTAPIYRKQEEIPTPPCFLMPRQTRCSYCTLLSVWYETHT